MCPRPGLYFWACLKDSDQVQEWPTWGKVAMRSDNSCWGGELKLCSVASCENSFFRPQGSWLVSQREKEKERDILIEKKAKDLTWWKLNSSVFLLSAGNAWSLSTEARRTSRPFILLYRWLSVWRTLMTASCKWRNEGRGTRSSVALPVQSWGCFWKDVQSHPASASAQPCLCSLPRDLVLSVLCGHQQLHEAVSTAGGSCSSETEFLTYSILINLNF